MKWTKKLLAPPEYGNEFVLVLGPGNQWMPYDEYIVRMLFPDEPIRHLTQEEYSHMIKVQSQQAATDTKRTQNVQFMRSTDVPKGGKITCKVIQMRKVTPADNVQFGDYLLRVSLQDGSKRVWPLRVNALVLAALVHKFGEDEMKWANKTFEVGTTYNPTFETDQLTVLED